jgi:hypothetical protein
VVPIFIENYTTMRLLTLIALVTFCYNTATAQHKPTKDETVKWLQEKLTQERGPAGRRTIRHNATPLCIVDKIIAVRTLEDNDFNGKIESYISWKQDEVNIQNDIFKNGKLTETYTYQVPLTAIAGAHVTNCQRNKQGYVNAYRDRPVFIHLKKNAAKVGHISFDKNGKATGNGTTQYHTNNSEADWDSYIPVAGNWDKDDKLRKSVLDAFSRLAELNDKKYTAK